MQNISDFRSTFWPNQGKIDDEILRETVPDSLLVGQLFELQNDRKRPIHLC